MLLYATGDKARSGDDWNVISHYKLFLKADQNGVTTEQLIVAAGGFEDAEIQIHWGGDLDQDSKINLIVDVSNHYNQSRIAVFLSSKAKPGELVEYFGKCSQVGC
jgi:hypothetical protein